MGVEYGLYDHASKEYIWLGKMCGSQKEPGRRCFQIESEKIADFLATRYAHSDGVRLEIRSDGGNMPEEEGGWTKLEDWCEDDDDS